MTLLLVGALALLLRPETGDPFEERLRREAPAAFEGSEWERTTALRDWAYQQIDVAGDPESYDRRGFEGRDPAEIFADFDEDQVGVLCGNAAISLRNLYHRFGYPAWALDVGVPGEFTHVVTLVQIDGGRIVLHDPFYGGDFGNRDVREVIAAARAGDLPEFDTAELPAREIITAAGITSGNTEPRDYADDPLWPGAWEQFENDGRDRDWRNLFAYPIKLYGEHPTLLAELKPQ